MANKLPFGAVPVYVPFLWARKIEGPRQPERLAARAEAGSKINSFSAKTVLVGPEGLTAALPLESGKSATSVPATPEEEESVRALSKRHRK
jgi:hypothetical protein